MSTKQPVAPEPVPMAKHVVIWSDYPGEPSIHVVRHDDGDFGIAVVHGERWPMSAATMCSSGGRNADAWEAVTALWKAGQQSADPTVAERLVEHERGRPERMLGWWREIGHDLVIAAHARGDLSEGQASAMLGLDRVSLRAAVDNASAAHEDPPGLEELATWLEDVAGAQTNTWSERQGDATRERLAEWGQRIRAGSRREGYNAGMAAAHDAGPAETAAYVARHGLKVAHRG